MAGSERFAWVPDVMRGEWLRPLEDEPFGSVLSIVPRGMEMYARVFHPVERDRPRRTGTWQGLHEASFFVGEPGIDALLDVERVGWADAAASCGTVMHAQAQYARLVRRDYGAADGVIAADGWRYGQTQEGNLDAQALSGVVRVLARHTSTPTAGIAAVWEGWGGLVSSAGVAYLEEGTGWNAGEPVQPAMLAPAGSGVLPREVAAGPRFELHGNTGRSYVLFEAGAIDFAHAAWPHHAPWVERPRWPQSPSLLWPDDHAWVLATEIDYDSTLIAGTRALIHELVRTPGLEVLPIRPEADLSLDGDQVN